MKTEFRQNWLRPFTRCSGSFKIKNIFDVNCKQNIDTFCKCNEALNWLPTFELENCQLTTALVSYGESVTYV